MTQKQFRHAVAIFCNVAVIFLVVLSVCDLLLGKSTGTLQKSNAECFCYFTVDSNLLAAFCALLMIPFNIRTICCPGTNPPRWVLVLKLTGTVAVTVTFLTVMTYLGTVYGYTEMLKGSNMYLHLVCPLLSILAFLLFELGGTIPLPLSIVSVFPVSAYAGVYYYMVLETGKWSDFYHFNDGGYWYFVLAGMLAGTVGLGMGICALYRLGADERQPQNRQETGATRSAAGAETDGAGGTAGDEKKEKPRRLPKTVPEVLAAIHNGSVQVEEVDAELLRPAASALAKEVLRREEIVADEVKQIQRLYAFEEVLLKRIVQENEKAMTVNAEQLQEAALRNMKLDETQAYLTSLEQEMTALGNGQDSTKSE